MILVVGATGELGERIVRRLVAEDRPVRALVRNTDGSTRMQKAGAEVVMGDLRRPDTLKTAVRRVHTVVSTANAVGGAGPDTIDAVDRKGTIALIDAAVEEGVHHFVYVSAYGAAADSPSMLLRAKAAVERRLSVSGVSATILRPDLFMESWVGGFVVRPVRAGKPVTIMGRGERRHSFIAAQDVAAVVVRAIAGERALGTVEFGGPEALTWLDVVERAADAVGRVIPVRHVRPGSPIPGLPDAVAQIAATLDQYDSVLDGARIAAELGVELTTLDEWLRPRLTEA